MDIDWPIIVVGADGDNFAADAGGGNGHWFWPVIAGSSDNNKTGVPCGVNTADEKGVFTIFTCDFCADGYI